MIAGALWMVAANVASLLGSVAVVRRLRTGSTAVDWLCVLLIRQLLVSAAVLLAGMTGMLSPAGLGLPCCAALVVLVARREHRDWSWLRPPSAGRISVIFAAILLLRLALQAWFFAPHLGDPLAYHLPKVAEWVQAGRFTREMGVHTHAPFPAGFELLETWWVVFLRHDVLIEAAGIEYVGIAFVAMLVLARRVGLASPGALLAAFLFVLTPAFHLSATSCLNDTPAAAMVVSAMALAAARAHYGIFAMAVGLGLGIKPTFGFALPGILLLAWFERKAPHCHAPSLSTAGAVALAGLAVGAYWYVRNTLWYGSPFYPLGSPGFVDPTPVQFGPSLHSFGANLANLVDFRIYDPSTVYGANTDYMTGWGAASFACGLVALPATARKDSAMRALALSFLLSLACSLTLIQDDPWCLKYVFYFPAVLCLAVAKLSESTPGVRVIALAAMGFSFLGTFLSYDFRSDELNALSAQPWQERTAANLRYAGVPVVPTDPVVGFYGGPTGAAYLLYRPDFSRRVVYLRAASSEALLAEIRASAIRTIFTPKATPEQQRALDDAVRNGYLTAISSRVYEVPAR